MAFCYDEPSHTFSVYLLVPGYTTEKNTPSDVDLRTPLVKYKNGEECPLSLNIPMVSAIMQSVSGPRMAEALAREGGCSFIFGSQSAESEAEMMRQFFIGVNGVRDGARACLPEEERDLLFGAGVPIK